MLTVELFQYLIKEKNCKLFIENDEWFLGNESKSFIIHTEPHPNGYYKKVVLPQFKRWRKNSQIKFNGTDLFVDIEKGKTDVFSFADFVEQEPLEYSMAVLNNVEFQVDFKYFANENKYFDVWNIFSYEGKLWAYKSDGNNGVLIPLSDYEGEDIAFTIDDEIEFDLLNKEGLKFLRLYENRIEFEDDFIRLGYNHAQFNSFFSNMGKNLIYKYKITETVVFKDGVLSGKS